MLQSQGFDLTICWRVSVHLRVWIQPMWIERMGTRFVRCRILSPRLTRAIIKPGGWHLCGTRMRVFIYADYSSLLSALYSGCQCFWGKETIFLTSVLCCFIVKLWLAVCLCMTGGNYLYFTKQRQGIIHRLKGISLFWTWKEWENA